MTVDVNKQKNREREFRENALPFELHTVRTKTQWWSRIEVENVLRNLSPADCGALLDIGCSDGRFLSHTHRKFPHLQLTGIDFARNPLKGILDQKLPAYPVCADMCALPFAPDTFDYAVAIQTVQQLPSRAARVNVYSGIRRVLKEKGKFVLTVLNQKS